MSKMSNIHLELTEQANELGFESIEEAKANGYVIRYSGQEAFLVPNIDKELEKAHEAWLKERDEVLGGLVNLMVHSVYDYDTVIKAYNFIKEQCHD